MNLNIDLLKYVGKLQKVEFRYLGLDIDNVLDKLLTVQVLICLSISIIFRKAGFQPSSFELIS